MSEMVMFQEKKVKGKTYNAKAGYGGISHTSTLATDKYNKHLCNTNTSNCKVANEGSFAVHSIILTDSTNKYAVSVAMGVPLGVDASLKIMDDWYATGVVGKATDGIQGQLIF